MPPASEFPTASVALSVGLSLIALFLGLRQWYERRARESDLSEEDLLHFSRQDTRRRLGVGVLSTIALLVFADSRISTRAGDTAILVLVILWLVVLALIVLLLILALADLIATRSYARRHRRRIFRESINSIRRRSRGP
jgi:hypothetical protein